MDNHYDYLRQKAYYARMMFRDEDIDLIAPIYIKVPKSILEPPRNIKILIEAIEEIFKVECMVLFVDVEETEDGLKMVAEDGMFVDRSLLLVTTQINGDEIITGIITPEGEYELLCLDGDSITWLVVDDEVIKDLGLERVEELTIIRRRLLREFEFMHTEDNVYFPHLLYD